MLNLLKSDFATESNAYFCAGNKNNEYDYITITSSSFLQTGELMMYEIYF